MQLNNYQSEIERGIIKGLAMQNLRPPWRRARTPTPIEMGQPTCGSLDFVTQQTAFSESSSSGQHVGTEHRASCTDADKSYSFLRLPPVLNRRRSRSFDFSQQSVAEYNQDSSSSPSTLLVVPVLAEPTTPTTPLFGMLRRSFSRHSSSSDRGSTVCVHCLCADEYERRCCQNVTQVATHEDAIFQSDSDSECPSGDSSNCGSLEGNVDDTSGRLSFLGESFECRQKVEPWIRKNELTPDSRAVIRRGRSLGLATHDVTISEPNLRRGGSECRADPNQPELLLDEPKWRREECRISFNISFSLSEPVAPSLCVATEGSMTPGRRSPSAPGTPRLERQEALSGWLESEPSLDLLTPASAPSNYAESRQVSTETQTSMETRASASLEVDSGTSVQQQVSFESQNSVSLDVLLPDSIRQPSLDSQTSVDSMASSIGRCSGVSGGSSLANRPSLARRKCLSAGASPSTSPPICLSNSRFALCCGNQGSRLNLHMGSSSEYGEVELEAPPSPPAEIYLTVPILPSINKMPVKHEQSVDDEPRRQRLVRNNSTRNSFEIGIRAPLMTRRGLSRSGDSLRPRPDIPFRSRSIEIGLSTAHRTEYHDLAGSDRRQQWVSRLKYDFYF